MVFVTASTKGEKSKTVFLGGENGRGNDQRTKTDPIGLSLFPPAAIQPFMGLDVINNILN